MQENIPLQLGEEIRSIHGYEGLYSITSYGRVWSHLRYVKSKGGSFRKCGEKILKLGLASNDYLIVILSKRGKQKTYSIHRLEALAFIPNSLNLPEVNHKDTNKQNNYKDNLEWCTRQDNQNHALINGLKFKKSSIFYGIYFHKGQSNRNKPWVARITIDGKRKYIGYYLTELGAARVYNNYVIKYNLNRPLNNFN